MEGGIVSELSTGKNYFVRQQQRKQRWSLLYLQPRLWVRLVYSLALQKGKGEHSM